MIKHWKLFLRFPTFCILVLFQVVQEYERAVIFRLGRLRKGDLRAFPYCTYPSVPSLLETNWFLRSYFRMRISCWICRATFFKSVLCSQICYILYFMYRHFLPYNNYLHCFSIKRQLVTLHNISSKSGGAKGPGIFFVIPCIDTYRRVDLRTVSFDVPPQEVIL